MKLAFLEEYWNNSCVIYQFLSSFAKLQKVTITFFMSVFLSVDSDDKDFH
jgi:hypothetical protein